VTTTCAGADAAMPVASNDDEEEKVPCMLRNEVEVHWEDILYMGDAVVDDEDDEEENLRTQEEEEEEDHVGRSADNDNRKHGEAEEEPSSYSYSYHTDEDDGLFEGKVFEQRLIEPDLRTCDGVVDSPW